MCESMLKPRASIYCVSICTLVWCYCSMGDASTSPGPNNRTWSDPIETDAVRAVVSSCECWTQINRWSSTYVMTKKLSNIPPPEWVRILASASNGSGFAFFPTVDYADVRHHFHPFAHDLRRHYRDVTACMFNHGGHHAPNPGGPYRQNVKRKSITSRSPTVTKVVGLVWIHSHVTKGVGHISFAHEYALDRICLAQCDKFVEESSSALPRTGTGAQYLSRCPRLVLPFGIFLHFEG